MAHYIKHWPVALIGVISLYLFLAALQGETGFFRYLQLQAQIKQEQVVLAGLVGQREELVNLTTRMSDDYLDIDLLDEQARKRLGLVRVDEIIVR